jgi:hypothetical protein
MSTLHLVAYQVIDRAAALLNDPNKTDYTSENVNVYLNMAIEELNERLIESNVGLTNQVSPIYPVKVGDTMLVNLPFDLVEIQEVGERGMGTNDVFIPLPRKEFPDEVVASSSLLYWYWHEQKIKFNPNGATTPREIQLNYIRRPFVSAQEGNEVIGTVLAMPFLSYKTAALCAQFIGENPTRSAMLEMKAEESIERIIGISNKGRQQMMTRHRPFRAGYKSRGY